jgi:FMN-dependent oxidoreductase (nitrilotriacetate monooxygenase family)
VVRDGEKRIFTHPEKVHEIGHKGKFFEVPGYQLTEPSPQRTPVLYQAGASGPGKEFAASHAECIFVAAPTKSLLKAYVSDIRERAAKAGRDPRKLYIYNLATIIADATDARAQAKFEEYKKYASYDGALVFLSGWSGIDFGQYAPTDLVKKVETNAIISMVEHFSGKDKSWSIEELAQFGGIGGLGPVFVGSPAKVADILQEWVDETDVDGFNLAYAVTPESFEDVVEIVVPELQRRGAYPKSYRPGTLREKLFSDGPYLQAPHPAAQYRDIEAVKRRQAKPAAATANLNSRIRETA